jgi:3-mercaptopyruvate sulfurtransferase SseA
MSGFAHPEYLVTTEWLAAHLDDPNVIVLDCAMHLGHNACERLSAFLG